MKIHVDDLLKMLRKALFTPELGECYATIQDGPLYLYVTTNSGVKVTFSLDVNRHALKQGEIYLRCSFNGIFIDDIVLVPACENYYLVVNDTLVSTIIKNLKKGVKRMKKNVKNIRNTDTVFTVDEKKTLLSLMEELISLIKKV